MYLGINEAFSPTEVTSAIPGPARSSRARLRHALCLATFGGLQPPLGVAVASRSGTMVSIPPKNSGPAMGRQHGTRRRTGERQTRPRLGELGGKEEERLSP